MVRRIVQVCLFSCLLVILPSCISSSSERFYQDRPDEVVAALEEVALKTGLDLVPSESTGPLYKQWGDDILQTSVFKRADFWLRVPPNPTFLARHEVFGAIAVDSVLEGGTSIRSTFLANTFFSGSRAFGRLVSEMVAQELDGTMVVPADNIQKSVTRFRRTNLLSPTAAFHYLAKGNPLLNRRTRNRTYAILGTFEALGYAEMVFGLTAPEVKDRKMIFTLGLVSSALIRLFVSAGKGDIRDYQRFATSPYSVSR